ncbi:MAG: transglutaminaseTgpA domain-containing protein [Aureliella sp.]
MDIARVKRLRRSITLHFIVIAWLTAMLVATGSQSYFLPILIFCVGIAAYIFVDTLEWFEVGRLGSYTLMTIATIVAAGNYIYYTLYSPSEPGQLMAVASLLVFPEAVLFLQRKNLRIFEQLAVFLLLEMIVAALVNDNIVFGLLLAPIMLLWVSSLFLFARYATLVYVDPGIESPIPHLAELIYQKLRKKSADKKPKPTVDSQVVTPKNVQGSRLARRLLQSVPIGIGAVAFAGFFFYLMPRTSPGSLRSPLVGQRQIGLPKALSFGIVGRLKANDSPTMRVSLRQFSKDQEYELLEPPYIRGHIMDSYFPPRSQQFDTEGQWVFSGIHEFRRLPKSDYARGLQKFGRDMVRVEFDIRRQYLPTIVTMGSAFELTTSQPKFRLGYEKFNSVMAGLNPEDAPSGTSVVYEIGSAEFSNGRQLPITPVIDATSQREIRAQQSNYPRLKASASFTELRPFYQRILATAKTAEADRYDAARAIEKHFLYSQEFSYSLDLTLPEDSALDPIVDFVLNKRKGHCQYYAASMVGILRALGIPSRIVAGYYPREYNRRGKYFAVKQSDAHTWAEGLFSHDELVGTDMEKWLTDTHSFYWVRFDATPPSEDGENGIVDQEGQTLDYAEKLWKDYVVDGQKLSGRNSLYAPVAENSRTAVEDFMNQFADLRNGLRTNGLNAPVSLAAPLIILLVVVGLAALVVWRIYHLLPRFAPRLAKRLGVGKSQSTFQQAFFARLVNMLERLGIQRSHHETASEYVQGASETLSKNQASADPTAIQLPMDALTKHYYQQRFGNYEPSEADQREIAQALVEVENAAQSLDSQTKHRK